MASLAHKIVYGVLSVAPLGLYERLMPRDIMGLAYHVVSDRRLPHVQGLYGYKSVAAFRRDLSFLKDHYHVATYRELHDHRLSGAPLPRGSVALTFDDGFAECFGVIRPLLLEFGLPASFFVNSDFLDNQAMFYRNQASLAIEKLLAASPAEASEWLCAIGARLQLKFPRPDSAVGWLKSLTEADTQALDACCAALDIDVAAFLERERPYLTREQIVQMASEGFTFGGHTRRHKRLDGSTDPAVVEREIVDSCRDVQAITGQSVVPFAFPFRGPVGRNALARIRAKHDFVGLLFDSAGAVLDRPFIVQRISADTTRGSVGDTSNLSWLFQEARIRRLVAPLRRRDSADVS